MALDLLKRGESPTPLSAAEHDANFTSIETEVNNKTDLGHTHTEADITDLTHDAVSLLGVPLDATVGSPSDGDILVFRDLGGDWVLEAKPAGASPNVNDLGDVTITAVADNEVLAFDTATSEWINQTAAEAGLATAAHTHAIDDLSDVAIVAPANNEVLAFDTGAGDWINQTALEAGLQALLSTVGVTVRGAAGALDFSGGTDGQVWTVQADGSIAFEIASAHEHVVEDISDAGALASLSSVGSPQIDLQAVTLEKIVDQAGVTPGSYTSANITVSQEGIITAVASGPGGSGGLSTIDDANTAITIGDLLDGTHRRLTADSAITLTLDAQATVGTKVAVTPKGSGVVTVQVEAGATYELPLDDDAGRTTSFVVGGYVLFECVANSDTNSAVFDVVGETDHADLADNEIDFADEVVSRPELKDYAETVATPSSSAGTLTLDLETGNVFAVTLAENTTVAFTNPPASGKAGTATLILTQDGTGSRTVAWPASVKWAGGVAPTISTAPAAIDIFTFLTTDAGTSWFGFEGGIAFA